MGPNEFNTKVLDKVWKDETARVYTLLGGFGHPRARASIRLWSSGAWQRLLGLQGPGGEFLPGEESGVVTSEKRLSGKRVEV